jgi:hypothetical protein
MPACFQATVHVDGPARVSGICVGFDVNLADEISLSTSVHATRTHWGQTFFPVCPVLDGAADVPIEVEIRPRIPSNRNSWSWRVASGEEFRRGDAMQGMSGDKEALLRQLGIQVASSASGAR